MIVQIGVEKVLLLSAPYVSQRICHQWPLERLKAFVAGAEAVGLALEVPFINVFDEMLKREPDSLLQADGLHFSMAGYEFLGELIVSKVNQIRTEKE